MNILDLEFIWSTVFGFLTDDEIDVLKTASRHFVPHIDKYYDYLCHKHVDYRDTMFSGRRTYKYLHSKPCRREFDNNLLTPISDTSVVNRSPALYHTHTFIGHETIDTRSRYFYPDRSNAEKCMNDPHKIYYYEIEYLSSQADTNVNTNPTSFESNQVFLGLCSKSNLSSTGYARHTRPTYFYDAGHVINSFAMNCNNGTIYSGSALFTKKPFTDLRTMLKSKGLAKKSTIDNNDNSDNNDNNDEQDIYGCGYIPSLSTIIFTCNGELINEIDVRDYKTKLVTIGRILSIHTSQEINFNLGQRSFAYNFDDFDNLKSCVYEYGIHFH